MKIKSFGMLAGCIALAEIHFFLQGWLTKHHVHEDFLSKIQFLRRKVSPLNDQTLFYNHTVRRPWIDDWVVGLGVEKPPAMLLLTDFAWNQPNQSTGKTIYRGFRTRELYEGIINHPWFHPTGWRDLNDGTLEISNTTRYYVFLDRETAGEKNYPYYGRGVTSNADRLDDRDTCCGFQTLLIDDVMSSRVMQAKHAKYILMDGSGLGPRNRFEEARVKYPEDDKVVFLSISARHDQLNLKVDQGLGPPAIRPCRLTAVERREIATCHKPEESLRRRPVLLSLLASIRGNARYALAKLHNGNDMIITHDQKDAVKNLNSVNISDAYHLLITSSQFGAAPKGDNLFSYRFPEVASCGAIPVVYADDWQLPFVFDVVDWQDAVIIIPEIDAVNSREILEAIPHKKRCRMRQKALELYENHLATPLKTMATVIEGMERLAQRDMNTYTGDRNQVQPSSVSFLNTGVCAPSPITDHTLCYRDSIERPWLGDTSIEQPPIMLLLSGYGWNNPTPLSKHPKDSWYRSMRTRELVEGVINHPMFHPNGFDKYVNHNMKLYTTVTYIFFLDMESCAEPSYPHYGYQHGVAENADTSGGRTTHFRDRSHRYLKEIWRAVDLRGIDFRVVFFDCTRHGPFEFRENNRDPHLALASVSASRSQILEGFDQGMPLPAYRSFALSENQRVGICNDKNRPILLSFSGHLYSHPRKLLRELHNGQDVIIGSPKEHREWMTNSTADPYFHLAVRSQFAAVPRGLHLGTSRLVEMMSAGAIPVIFADHWVLPLDRTIPWSEIAVILPEDDARIAVEVLQSISAEKRCQMRTKMMEIYDKYLSTGEGVIAGLVKGVQATGRIRQQLMVPSADAG